MRGRISSRWWRKSSSATENVSKRSWNVLIPIQVLPVLLFTVVLLTLGPTIFSLLGGQGRVLEEAVAYSTVLFSGAGNAPAASAFVLPAYFTMFDVGFSEIVVIAVVALIKAES